MIAAALDDVTRALHTALLADADIADLLHGDRLYDAVPQKAAYPYAVFGKVGGKRWSGTGFTGTEATWQIEVYSRKRGRGEAVSIATALEAAITQVDISLATLRVVDLQVGGVETQRLRDGRTFRATLNARALVEQV
jgi:hypothetical protein